MENCLVLFVLCALTATVAVIPDNDFERGVLKLIEKCKRGDVGSLPVPVPSLESLTIPPQTFNVGSDKLYVGEMEVYGMSELSVDSLSTSPLGMSIKFSVPVLKIRSDYYHLEAQEYFGITFINDEGSFACDLHNVKVRADVQFRASGSSTVVTSLDLSYSVESIQLDLSGSSDFVTERVRNKIWNNIRRSQTKQKLQNEIKDRARQYLRGHTPEEFMTIIAGI